MCLFRQARRFVLAFTGVMAAQVPKLEPPVLAELSQELQRFQVGDQQLWEALVQDTARRPQELKPLDIVYLLDAFRRALSFGVRPAPALEATCQRIMECYQDFNSKQCTGALGSVCRLSGHIDSSQQYKVMHLLLGQWLASQPAKWETTPSNQVISVAVSLSGLGVLSDRTETFLAAASSWALRWGAPEGGALSAEDLVVLLWSLKEMTPLGLARYRELVQLSLVRIRAAATYEDWTLVRQGQALEVLLSAKHALVEDGADLAVAEELLLGIEAPMTAVAS
ncbi:unnamed protein product [Effrenium voratum]|nr:unnamed protein product [Effrenium voratum]